MHLYKRIFFFFLCFLMSVFLSACGSKGDLYQTEESETVKKSTEKVSQKVTKAEKKPS